MTAETCGGCGKVKVYANCAVCEGRRNREDVDRLENVVREVRASADEPCDAQRERELLKELERFGHPDPLGLMKAISERRSAPKQRGNDRRRE